VQPRLAAFHAGIGIDQGHFPVADGLDLRADQGKACLQGLVDFVLMARLSIARQNLVLVGSVLAPGPAATSSLSYSLLPSPGRRMASGVLAGMARRR